MRRGSIIGPLILIGLGLLFLLRNFVPDIPIWDLLSRFWPVLLIVWGTLRLIEILFWAATSKPLPRNGISGGEWVLIFFICVFGASAYTARHYAGWFPNGRALHGLVVNMGESFDYPLKEVSQPCARNCRVIIENFRGNAKITGGDTSSVKVNGRKTVRAFQQTQADQADQQTPLEVVAHGNEMTVRTNQDHVSDSLQVSADLELQVPMNASVEVHGRSGDLDIQNVNGPVELTSDNAGIRLENLGGDVHIETRKSDVIHATGVKGSVDLKGRGQDIDLQDISGTVNITGTYVGQVQFHNLAQPLRYEDSQVTLGIEKIPGQLHLGLGELNGSNLVGPVHVTARSRDVQLTDFTQSLDLNLERGDVELRPGRTAPRMSVHIARSGDIDLGLPVGSRFDLKATTARGDVSNDFGSPLKSSEAGHGGVVEGVVGGGPEIRMDTNRGSITVRKAGESEVDAPKPPNPPKPPVKIEDQ